MPLAAVVLGVLVPGLLLQALHWPLLRGLIPLRESTPPRQRGEGCGVQMGLLALLQPPLGSSSEELAVPGMVGSTCGLK